MFSFWCKMTKIALSLAHIYPPGGLWDCHGYTVTSECSSITDSTLSFLLLSLTLLGPLEAHEKDHIDSEGIKN